MKHVSITCNLVLSFLISGYKIPNKPSLAGLADNGVAGINCSPIDRIDIMTAGTFL